MSERKLEDMSKEELIRELKKLESAAHRFAARAGEADRERLIHDLHVHQVELEMQNRELRDAHERLELATSRYSNLYDLAPIGYCTLDLQGIILEINLTGAAFLGAVRDALLGKPFTWAAPLEDRRQFLAHMRRCAENEARVTSELGFSAGMERRRTVQLVSEPVLDEEGEPIAYRTMLVDVSDLKNLQGRLRLLAEAGEQLASSLEPAALPEVAASILVPALADFCMLDVVSEGDVVERIEVRFADARKHQALAEQIRASASPPGRLSPQSRVIASGEPLLLARGVEELRGRLSYSEPETDALREAGLRSLMVVPLRARGQTLGALTLAIVESERSYDAIDLEVAQDVAARVAMALDNARLYAKVRRAAEDLRVAEAKSSGILSISVDAIISIDEDQRITLFNEGAEAIFGYSKTEAIGERLDVLIPERFRAAHRRHVERFARGEVVSRKAGHRGMDIIGLRKNGEEFPVDASISKLAVGGRTILTVVLRDVTEPKRSEKEQMFLADVGPALAATLRFEDTLVAVADLALRLCDVCIIDMVEENGDVRRVRVQTRDSSKQWASDILLEVGVNRGRPHLARSVLETQVPLVVGAVTPEVIASWAQSDEHRRALEALGARSVMSVPLLARGRLAGALTFVSSSRTYEPADLRLVQEFGYRAALAVENARLYRLAERAVQARDETLGVVAHDLRNPLGNILLEAALLRRGIEPERSSQEPVEAIERAAKRMKRLIEDLLDVARIEAGAVSPECAPLAVGTVIAEFVATQRPTASSKAIELGLDVAPDAGEVFADRDRLLQALENLVGNAVRFTQAGGRITVGAKPKDGEVLFWVRDTGSGIDAADLPHLFDRFWQARRTGRQGAGLGLPIVKGIVEAHGGRIWVESKVGAGSTFYFTLPGAAAENQESAEARTTEAQPTRLVLLAEDEPDMRDMLRKIIERAGYEVSTAQNGAQALERLHGRPLPFLIILDLVMPVMDGWAFLEERNRDPELRSIPVIVVSGEHDVEDKVVAAHANFMRKPLSINRLIETIEHVVH